MDDCKHKYIAHRSCGLSTLTVGEPLLKRRSLLAYSIAHCEMQFEHSGDSIITANRRGNAHPYPEVPGLSIACRVPSDGVALHCAIAVRPRRVMIP